jgi:hypothetical protein
MSRPPLQIAASRLTIVVEEPAPAILFDASQGSFGRCAALRMTKKHEITKSPHREIT